MALVFAGTPGKAGAGIIQLRTLTTKQLTGARSKPLRVWGHPSFSICTETFKIPAMRWIRIHQMMGTCSRSLVDAGRIAFQHLRRESQEASSTGSRQKSTGGAPNPGVCSSSCHPCRDDHWELRQVTEHIGATSPNRQPSSAGAETGSPKPMSLRILETMQGPC